MGAKTKAIPAIGTPSQVYLDRTIDYYNGFSESIDAFKSTYIDGITDFVTSFIDSDKVNPIILLKVGIKVKEKFQKSLETKLKNGMEAINKKKEEMLNPKEAEEEKKSILDTIKEKLEILEPILELPTDPMKILKWANKVVKYFTGPYNATVQYQIWFIMWQIELNMARANAAKSLVDAATDLANAVKKLNDALSKIKGVSLNINSFEDFVTTMNSVATDIKALSTDTTAKDYEDSIDALAKMKADTTNSLYAAVAWDNSHFKNELLSGDYGVPIDSDSAVNSAVGDWSDDESFKESKRTQYYTVMGQLSSSLPTSSFIDLSGQVDKVYKKNYGK